MESFKVDVDTKDYESDSSEESQNTDVLSSVLSDFIAGNLFSEMNSDEIPKMDPLKFGSIQHRVISAIIKDDKTENETNKLKSALKNLINDWNYSQNIFTLSNIIGNFIKEYIGQDINKQYEEWYVKNTSDTIVCRCKGRDILKAFSGWISHLDTLEKICDEINIEPYVIQIKKNESMNKFDKKAYEIINEFIEFCYSKIQDPNSIFGGSMIISSLKLNSSKFYNEEGKFMKISPSSVVFCREPCQLAIKFFSTLSDKKKEFYKKVFIKLNKDDDYSSEDDSSDDES